jgi:hypothetical protein
MYTYHDTSPTPRSCRLRHARGTTCSKHVSPLQTLSLEQRSKLTIRSSDEEESMQPNLREKRPLKRSTTPITSTSSSQLSTSRGDLDFRLEQKKSKRTTYRSFEFVNGC